VDERRFARHTRAAGIDQLPGVRAAQKVDLASAVQVGDHEFAGGLNVAPQKHRGGGNQRHHLGRMLRNIEIVENAAEIPRVGVRIARGGG
jgi:hypothetical protein